MYRRLLRLSAQHWPIAIVALIGMLLEGAAAGAFTWLMEPMIDGTFVDRDPVVMRWLPYAIVGIFLVRGLAVYLADVGMARIGRSVVRELRERVMGKYLRMPTAWFDREGTARAASRLVYNAEQVYQASSEAVKVLVTDTFTLIALLAVMLMQSARLTLVLLVIAPLIGFIVNRVSRRYRRINRNLQDGIGEAAHIAEQTLAAQQVVKVYGAQAQESQRYSQAIRRNERLQLKITSTAAASTALVQILAAVGLAVIVAFAAHEAMGDRLKAGQFMSLIAAMMAMLPSIKRITTVQSHIQKGVAAASSLFEVLDAAPEADRGQVRDVDVRGELVFEQVGVRYPGSEADALAGIDLVCRPGTVTALVGRSGSGKSTLARLIPRLYQPSAGRIVLDGRPLDDYALDFLRAQIALVTQNVFLFDDTIAANIAFGHRAGADRAAIEAAAEAANAMEFIRRLPDGLDARVGENGNLLSGGQRQRIAIARALLMDAPILILDEATSALDSESERLVQDALARVQQGRTCVVIAHRLSTIQSADQIVVLDHGRAIECGTHAQLLEREGAYALLHRMQFRDA